MRLIVVRGSAEARNDLAEAVAHEAAVPLMSPRQVRALGPRSVFQEWVMPADRLDRRTRKVAAASVETIVDLGTPRVDQCTESFLRRRSIDRFMGRVINPAVQTIELSGIHPEDQLTMINHEMLVFEKGYENKFFVDPNASHDQ